MPKRNRTLIKLCCAVGGLPGCAWSATVKLVRTRKGHLAVRHTNDDGSCEYSASTLLGRPAWRALMNYLLANEEWPIDVSGLEFLSAHGVDTDWQGTALLLAWLVEKHTRRGLHMRELSYRQIAKLCQPYDYYPGVLKLWEDLGEFETHAETLGVRKFSLREVLDRYDCWSSENPLRCAIGRIQQAQAEFDSAFEPLEPLAKALLQRATRDWVMPWGHIAAMGHIGRKHRVGEYIRRYYRENRRLPLGRHQLPDDVMDVDFGPELPDPLSEHA